MTRSVSILTRALSAPDCARAIAGARRQPANSRRDSDIVVILEPSGAISPQALTRPKAFYAGAADDVNGRLARPIVIGRVIAQPRNEWRNATAFHAQTAAFARKRKTASANKSHKKRSHPSVPFPRYGILMFDFNGGHSIE